ncbi:MAG: helix-hairpin-helix domain-containing protein [Desulfobacterales bacterium]|nr:helix-hairpin-helix domain-containing protein [Desulfobacterales bacterium]
MKTAARIFRKKALKDLQSIPGVGKSIAEDLWNMGFRSPADLKELDPEKMYLDFQKIQGSPVDRCMLYVFRCAVYFASEKNHDPELLKWWNWKDRKLREP